MGNQTDNFISEMIWIMKENNKKDLTVYDAAFLLKSLERRMTGIAVSQSDYPSYLRENPQEADHLLASFQITYSQFFRNALTFAMLEQHILPHLLSRKAENGEVRVWSAGCSTGQEAYSIGILLEELIQASSKPMRFRIFATDLSRETLDEARAGIYDENGVSNIRVKHLKKYFTRMGETYYVDAQLKQKISFSE